MTNFGIITSALILAVSVILSQAIDPRNRMEPI